MADIWREKSNESEMHRGTHTDGALMHCGTTPGRFEKSNQLRSHQLWSEQVSDQANECSGAPEQCGAS